MDIIPKKNITLLRYVIKIIYPKQNSFLFLIYFVIKYIVDMKRHDKYKDQNFHKIGLICKAIPKNLHNDIVKSHKLKPWQDIQHQILVPDYIFYDLYHENIYYRDELSLWMNMKVYIKDVDIHWISKEKSYITNIKNIINDDLKLNKLHKSDNKNEIFDKSNKHYIERIVQIIPESRLSKNVVCIDDINYYNVINSFNSKPILDCNNIFVKFSPIKNINYEPQIAENVAIQMINCPFNIGTDLIDIMLDEYFSTPKFLHEHDCFAISLTEEYMKNLYFKYLEIMNDMKFLYFKCTRISNKASLKYQCDIDKDMNKSIGYFVVKGQTELVQEQNINCSIPLYKFNYIKDSINETINSYAHIDRYYIDNCPYGLNQYMMDLEKAIKPFLLDKQVNLLNIEFKCVVQPVFLLRGNAGAGRLMLMSLLAKRNGLNFLPTSCHHLTSSTAKQTEAKLDALLQKAKRCTPVLIYLQNFEIFAIDAEKNEDVRLTESFINKIKDLYEIYAKHCIIIVAGCDIGAEIKTNMSRIFLEEFTLKCLDRNERNQILKWMILSKNIIICDKKFVKICSNSLETGGASNETINTLYSDYDKWKCDPKIDTLIEKIASKTDTYLYEDLDTLIYLAFKNSLRELKKIDEFVEEGNLIREEDFDYAIEKLRKIRGKTLTALKVPKIQWEDVGGLENLKKEIFRTIELPLKFPHIMAKSGLKRSGILLWGPPGCGKTLVARAIASQLQASFLSVKGPELLDMYVGQSEKNMRDIFASARSSAPCVIFFDEAEAAAGARGAAGDAGGAADRLVSQLLAELDGVASNQGNSQSEAVIVIAATNRPDLVEPALLRPGRLDKLLYVGPYKGVADKVHVLKAACRGFNLDEAVNLDSIAENMPEKCTGADLASVVKQARHLSLSRTIYKLESDNIDASSVTEKDIILNQEDFQEALVNFVPSISENEMNYYESLKYKLC